MGQADCGTRRSERYGQGKSEACIRCPRTSVVVSDLKTAPRAVVSIARHKDEVKDARKEEKKTQNQPERNAAARASSRKAAVSAIWVRADYASSLRNRRRRRSGSGRHQQRWLLRRRERRWKPGGLLTMRTLDGLPRKLRWILNVPVAMLAICSDVGNGRHGI